MASEPQTFSVDEVASMLGVDVKTVYDHCSRGAIPHQRLGRRILFGRRAILDWLNAPRPANDERAKKKKR
jgi:excisionase family DNA binding protein